jgi:hypothetical protein
LPAATANVKRPLVVYTACPFHTAKADGSDPGLGANGPAKRAPRAQPPRPSRPGATGPLAGGRVSPSKHQPHPKGLRSHSCESLSALCCSAGGWPVAWAPGGVFLFPQAGRVSRGPPSDRAAAGVGDGCWLGDSDWPPGEARRLGRGGRPLHNLTPVAAVWPAVLRLGPTAELGSPSS